MTEVDKSQPWAEVYKGAEKMWVWGFFTPEHGWETGGYALFRWGALFAVWRQKRIYRKHGSIRFRNHEVFNV